MRLIVCLKPVPDPKHWNKLRLDPETKTLVRAGVPAVINPLDKKALEASLRLREAHGGEVIILSMAPPEAAPVLREALAMGADRAVVLSDRAAAGSDTLATAHILAGAVRKIGDFDLILCGDETIDGGTAQVSAQLAEFLDLPNLMHVSDIQAGPPGPLLVRSLIEQGSLLVEIAPPAVLSVAKEINEPRYVTLMNILQAEQKEIAVWSLADLCLSEPCIGLQGSPTQMADLFAPQRTKRAEMLAGEPREMARQLADRLHRLGYC